ncbi:MAG TPA: hypothetical protein V6D06_19435, partial [Trichocoleus sp.]
MSVSVSRDASSLWAQRLLQKHQAYSAQIEASSEATDLEPVVAACNEQIAIAPEVAQVLQHQLPDSLPSHPGYDRLSHIRASQGRWAEAVCLCREAQAQGWKGPWAERIARLTAAQQSS